MKNITKNNSFQKIYIGVSFAILILACSLNLQAQEPDQNKTVRTGSPMSSDSTDKEKAATGSAAPYVLGNKANQNLTNRIESVLLDNINSSMPKFLLGGNSNLFIDHFIQASRSPIRLVGGFIANEGDGNSIFPEVGDFNNDGIPDVLVPNFAIGTPGRVSVLIGIGDGNFNLMPTLFTNGFSPEFLVISDFNGDGNQDFAVTNINSNTVSVFLGDGTGKFNLTAGSPFNSGGEVPRQIVAADFNSDGRIDLAVTNGNADAPDPTGYNISIFSGDGTGGFTPAANSPIPLGENPFGLVKGDFNNDSKVDLAATTLTNGSKVVILLGDGAGNFTINRTAEILNATPNDIAAADFNNDGNQDLVVDDLATTNRNITILIGDGTGNFTFGTSVSIPLNAFGVTTADFNNDGNADILATGRRFDPSTTLSNTIILKTGNGDGTFADGGTLTIPSLDFLGTAVADFNGDNTLDFVAADNQNNPLYTFLSYEPSPGILQFAFADFRGSEAGGRATISVDRVREANGTGRLGTVTVNYAANGGAATGGSSCTAGVDYISTSGTLNFPQGVLRQTFPVTLCGDDINDSGETIGVTISNPGGGATIGSPVTATLTVNDINPQPAILGTAGASDFAVVFSDTGNGAATRQVPVTGLPAGASPHGIDYFGTDMALISNIRTGADVFVVQISTATVLSTINTTNPSGSGTIAVAPSLNAALTMGDSRRLTVIQAPFNSASPSPNLILPGMIESYQTQAIVFNKAGRAFVYHTTGISVLDAPYTSVAFTIPVSGNDLSGAIAISPDGNTLLTTRFGSTVQVFQAPFSAASTPTNLTVPNGSGLDGIAIAPNGENAIVVNANNRRAFGIAAPFSSSSVVTEIPLPESRGSTAGFEDVGISADSRQAILTGNGDATNDLAVVVQAPFNNNAVTSLIPIQGTTNPGRGAGSVRFIPPGIANSPALTIAKTAPATIISGANLTYTINYSNNGAVKASNVIIRDPLPAGTTFVSATNGGTLTNGNVIFNIGSLNANSGNRTVSFTVRVNTATGGTVTNNNYTIEGDNITPVAGLPVSTNVVTTTATMCSLPSVETESNNTAATANNLNGGNRIGGAITPAGDVDFYRVDNVAPGSIFFAATDTGTGPANAGMVFQDDTTLAVLAADGTTVIELDEDSGIGNGGDATRENSNSSAIAGRTLTAGGTYYIRVSGDSASDIVTQYNLFVSIISPGQTTPEVEPNDSFANATTLPFNSLGTGTVSSTDSATDTDFYAVSLTAGNVAEFYLNRLENSTGARLELIEPNGTSVILSIGTSFERAFDYAVPTSGIYYVRVFYNRGFSNSPGSANYRILVSQSACGTTPAVPPTTAMFDFDGDGKSDISVFRPDPNDEDNNFWRILQSSTNTIHNFEWGIAADFDTLTPADFDGDNKTDFAVWRKAEQNFYIYNSSDNSIRIENFGLTGDILTVGDWDGDGKADPAVYREGANSRFFYRGSNNNPNRNITFLPFGTTGDKPMRGDFDGDGKFDAAVFRPSNQTWYIRQSSNNQVRFVEFGLSSDTFVPADYDGDGKTDIAVYRNGTWYILQSSNNQVRYVQFGLATDRPVPADYDGDGKMDVAVYRDGVWYLNQSRNGFAAFSFGVSGDTPIPNAYINP